MSRSDRDRRLSLNFMSEMDEEADEEFSTIAMSQPGGIPNSPYNYSGVERSEYLFELERLERSDAHFKITMSVVYFIKGTIGVGYLGIHEGYSYAGIWTGLAVCLILGCIVPHTYIILGRSAQRLYLLLRVPKLSYPGVAEASLAITSGFGRKSRKTFRYTVELLLYVNFCGLCCLYELVIAEILKFALEHISTAIAEQDLDLRIYILIITLPLGITCACRNIKCLFFLVPFSVIADLFMAVCVGIAFFYSLHSAQNIMDRPVWISISGTFNFVAIYLYAIDGSVSLLPMENNMKRPRYLSTAINIGMFITVAFTTGIGFFAYWVWGDKCKTPFVLLMPTDQFFMVMQLILCILLCSSYAVSLWIPYKVVWGHFRKRIKSKKAFWAMFIELLHIIFITLIAIGYPFALKIMCILGIFICAPLNFIIPPIIEELVFWKEHRATIIRWRLLKNMLIIALGFAILIGGVIVNILEPELEFKT